MARMSLFPLALLSESLPPFGLASVWFSALIYLSSHQRHLAGMFWYPLSM
jgi:hypothetical protein